MDEAEWKTRRDRIDKRLRACNTLGPPTNRTASILKGLRIPAQGCEERATLGLAPRNRFNPERVASSIHQSWPANQIHRGRRRLRQSLTK